MTKLSRVFKDYQESGAMNALVNIHAAIDEHTFLTKSGSLVVILAVRGVDYECLDASQIDQIARRFESAVRIFDEKFRIYQYTIKRDGPAIPHRRYDNPVIQEAIASRIAYLNEKSQDLYSFEIYFAVVYEGGRTARAFPKSSRRFSIDQGRVSGSSCQATTRLPSWKLIWTGRGRF